MTKAPPIPTFSLLGETEDFSDLVHVEPISERSAPLNWSIRAHRHADIRQLFMIDQGNAAISLDSDRISIAPETFFFVPAQVVHAIEFTPGTSGTVISFPARNLGSIGLGAQSVEQALAMPFYGQVTKELKMFTDCLITAMDGLEPYRSQKIIGLANATLAALADLGGAHTQAPASGRQHRMERLASLVRQHMEDGWSVGDYADALSVSSGHLSRICRAATGQGAQAHVEGLVMDEACRLLAFTDLPVAEIGYRTGFFDPSYFSKRFRAARGVSPRTYRLQFVSTEPLVDGRGQRQVTADRA